MTSSSIHRHTFSIIAALLTTLCMAFQGPALAALMVIEVIGEAHSGKGPVGPWENNLVKGFLENGTYVRTLEGSVACIEGAGSMKTLGPRSLARVENDNLKALLGNIGTKSGSLLSSIMGYIRNCFEGESASVEAATVSGSKSSDKIEASEGIFKAAETRVDVEFDSFSAKSGLEDKFAGLKHTQDSLARKTATRIKYYMKKKEESSLPKVCPVIPLVSGRDIGPVRLISQEIILLLPQGTTGEIQVKFESLGLKSFVYKGNFPIMNGIGSIKVTLPSERTDSDGKMLIETSVSGKVITSGVMIEKNSPEILEELKTLESTLESEMAGFGIHTKLGGKAALYQSKGFLPDALGLFREAVSRDPETASLFETLANALIERMILK